jgi:hypothetical protein
MELRGFRENLYCFAARTSIPIFYQVHRGTKEYSVSDRIQALPFVESCRKERLVWTNLCIYPILFLTEAADFKFGKRVNYSLIAPAPAAMALA